MCAHIFVRLACNEPCKCLMNLPCSLNGTYHSLTLPSQPGYKLLQHLELILSPLPSTGDWLTHNLLQHWLFASCGHSANLAWCCCQGMVQHPYALDPSAKVVCKKHWMDQKFHRDRGEEEEKWRTQSFIVRVSWDWTQYPASSLTAKELLSHEKTTLSFHCSLVHSMAWYHDRRNE